MTWQILLAQGYGSPTPDPDPLLRLSITLAVVTGTAGSVLALQAWRRFRGAPFGNALGLLPAFMGLFTLFHVILLVAPEVPSTVEVIESGAFVILTGFMVLMVRLHRRMSRRPAEEGS